MAIIRVSGFETGDPKKLLEEMNESVEQFKRGESGFDLFSWLLKGSQIGEESGADNVGCVIIGHKDFSFRFDIDPDNPYQWKLTIRPYENND